MVDWPEVREPSDAEIEKRIEQTRAGDAVPVRVIYPDGTIAQGRKLIHRGPLAIVNNRGEFVGMREEPI